MGFFGLQEAKAQIAYLLPDEKVMKMLNLEKSED